MTATAPASQNTYELIHGDPTRDPCDACNWLAGTSRPGVHVSVGFTYGTDLAHITISDRVPGLDSLTTTTLHITVHGHRFDLRFPQLGTFVGDLLRRRTRPAEGPSPVDSARALLDELGFADVTPQH